MKTDLDAPSQDAGTGIQPFLPPVATGAAQTIQVAVYRPLAYVAGAVKAAAAVVVSLLYLILAEGVGALLVRDGTRSRIFHDLLTPALALQSFSPPLKHAFVGAVSKVLLRLLLLCMGYVWLDHDFVSTKRGVT